MIASSELLRSKCAFGGCVMDRLQQELGVDIPNIPLKIHSFNGCLKDDDNYHPRNLSPRRVDIRRISFLYKGPALFIVGEFACSNRAFH